MKQELDKYSLQFCPLESFNDWYKKATEKEESPSAFALATSTTMGIPSVRYLLFKGLINSKFSFFTNKNSPKAKDLKENPKGSMAFYWHKTERQVRVSGIVEEMSPELLHNYCQNRPRLSQAATFISRQSQSIESKNTILNDFDKCLLDFEGKEIPVPPQWGGYLVRPLEMEFFVYGEHRLNDRFLYKRNKESEPWDILRLAP